jgi:hypothetical protein
MFNFLKIRYKFGDQAHLNQRDISQRKFRSFVFLFSLLSLTLRFAIPPVVLTGTTHDDELMIRLASQIMKGNWLGDYSTLGHLTLAKSAGFPMFLAATSWLPWSQVVSVHMILVLAIVLFVREFRMLGLNRFLSLVMLAFLLFFPRWFDDYMSRIYREGLLTAITFLFISFTLAGRRHLKQNYMCKRFCTQALQFLILLAVGFSLGFLVIIKNFWMPASLMLTIILGGELISRIKTKPTFKSLIFSLAVMFTPIMAGLSIPVVAVSYMNFSHYGVFALENYGSGEFPRSISLLSSIEPSGTRPYIQVTSDQRVQAYRISPTFALLRPFLEQPDGVGWRSAACNQMNICDESGAWFPWDLRDAVQFAGLADNASQFEKTFRTIADDIQRACQSDLIRCGSRGIAPGIGDPFDVPIKYLIDAEAQAVNLLIDLPSGSGTRSTVDSKHPMYEQWKSVVPTIEPWLGPPAYQADNYGLGDLQSFLNNVYQKVWPILIFSGALGLLISPRANGNWKYIPFRLFGFASLSSVVIGTMILAFLEANSGAYLTFGGNLYVIPLLPFVFLFIIGGLARLSLKISNHFDSLQKCLELSASKRNTLK